MINTMEISAEELPGLDLFHNCRLCLAKEKVSVDIFSEGHEIRLLYYKIISCLPIHITQDEDKLPRKICTQCNEKVDNFYQFWTLTAKTQKTLLDWVEKKDLVQAPKIKTENIPPGEVSFKQENIDYSDDDNDRYDDDDNVSEEDLEPSAMVKVCEETDEAGPSSSNIKLSHKSRRQPRSKTLPDEHRSSDKFDPEEHISNARPDTNSDGERKPYLCNLCGRSFKHRKHCRRHVKEHSIKKRYSCHLCGRSFPYKYNIVKHMISHCNDKPFECATCQKTFKTNDEVKKHERVVHQGMKYKINNKYLCTFCPKSFSYHQALKDHQYIHTGEKIHQCKICEGRFATKSSLVGHVRSVHEGRKRPAKPCTCELCGKTFVRRQGHYVHMKYVHNVGGSVPQCPICKKFISSKKNYVAHMNVHAGEKPYCCEFCGKKWASKEYLKKHMLVHTGETPYKCTMCYKSFKQNSTLKTHCKKFHPGLVAI